jgi:hypothetical protein
MFFIFFCKTIYGYKPIKIILILWCGIFWSQECPNPSKTRKNVKKFMVRRFFTFFLFCEHYGKKTKKMKFFPKS